MKQVIKALAIVGAAVLLVQLNSSGQRNQKQPSISFGTANVSLGMTVEQVEGRLAEAARHLQFVSNKRTTALVYQNGVPDGMEGQVTFGANRAVYAAYQMPNADSADELAQEIASAVEAMEIKVCTASNYSAHGTGGGFSQTIFECGSKRFAVTATQALGSRARNINVEIEMGNPVVNAK